MRTSDSSTTPASVRVAWLWNFKVDTVDAEASVPYPGRTARPVASPSPAACPRPREGRLLSLETPLPGSNIGGCSIVSPRCMAMAARRVMPSGAAMEPPEFVGRRPSCHSSSKPSCVGVTQAHNITSTCQCEVRLPGPTPASSHLWPCSRLEWHLPRVRVQVRRRPLCGDGVACAVRLHAPTHIHIVVNAG